MTVVSLFSGAGGLDLGLIKAGNKVIWANDVDESAAATCTVGDKLSFAAKNGGYALLRVGGHTLKLSTAAIYGGGTMKLLSDMLIGDLQFGDEESRLDLNGFTLTIRSLAHRDCAGWTRSQIIDSSTGGTGGIVWQKPAFRLIVRCNRRNSLCRLWLQQCLCFY